jgi:hypothetical protein
MITVGSELLAIVQSIELDMHHHPVIVVEIGGEHYQLAGPLGAPTGLPKPLRLQGAQEAVEGPLVAKEASQGPRIGDTGADFEAPRASRVTPWSTPEDIGVWLADHPDDTPKFAQQMSLKRRRLTAEVIVELLGPTVKTTDVYRSFVQTEPPPAEGSGMQWGRESGLGMQLFGEKLNTRLEREARQSVAVDEGLNGVEQARAKGSTLTPRRAAEQLENWKKR